MGLLHWLYRVTGIGLTNEDADQVSRADAQEQFAQATYDHARRSTRWETFRPGANPLLAGERGATIDDFVSIRGKVELREGCRIGYGSVLLGDSNPDAPPLIVGRNARIGPYCVIRAAEAPVIIGDDVSLGPHNVINYNNPLEMPRTGDVRIGKGTHTGAFCTFGNHVRIGENNHISGFTRILYHTTIGDGNRLEGCLLGVDPQDLTFYDELDDLTERRKSGIAQGMATATYLFIGNDNIIRENVRIARGTSKNPNKTTHVHNNNLIMDHTHIAHDCNIGSEIIITTGSKLAGHVVLENYVNLAGSIKIAPFVHVGMCAFVTGDCAVKRDLMPFFVAGPEKGSRDAVSTTIPNYRRVQHMLMQHNEHMDNERLERVHEELRAIAGAMDGNAIYNSTETRDELYKRHPRRKGYDGMFVTLALDFVEKSLERQKTQRPRFSRGFTPW